jgi:gentisate 1,2-dioxygenase
MFDRSTRPYPMFRYPWADTKAALLSLATDNPQLDCVQVTYVNPETGADAENILGFYAVMLRPAQTLRLPARSPAQVFHIVEGQMAVTVESANPQSFQMTEADTCAIPGYEAIKLENLRSDLEAFVFIADESPLHRKLGIFENRG